MILQCYKNLTSKRARKGLRLQWCPSNIKLRKQCFIKGIKIQGKYFPGNFSRFRLFEQYLQKAISVGNIFALSRNLLRTKEKNVFTNILDFILNSKFDTAKWFPRDFSIEILFVNVQYPKNNLFSFFKHSFR